MTKRPVRRIESGVSNLDQILRGGLPKGSVTVICGAPGSGKTILSHQIGFHNASSACRVLYFNTLSEPTAKTLRYLRQFDFFDATKLEHIHFVDLGVILRSKGLEQATVLIAERLKAIKPAMVVIDSFKAFDDLASSTEERRKFGYEVVVKLMAWEAVGLLLGEYAPQDYMTNPIFSVADGLITVSQRESSGEQQRFVQVVKMRGTEHDREPHAFAISSAGIDVFAPRLTIHRDRLEEPNARCHTGIHKLDALLGTGIPRGSSLLVAGAAGTGKTALSLEFVYRGALAGEKGIVFSFEETPDRLLASSRGFGWNLEREIKRGMVEVVFIPQPDITVEADLLMMRDRIQRMKARRVVIDSVSVFLHKITDAQIAREKVYQLASIVQNGGSVGFFTTDIPYGSNKISRFGVEETVVDGVILVSSEEHGLDRERHIEVYKLRNTAHLKGRHDMVIGPAGIAIFPRYTDEEVPEPPRPIEPARMSSGVPRLDELIGGGLLRRSATIIAGSPGIGKSTFGTQFILEGAKHGEHGVFFTLEENPEQLIATAEALKLPLRDAVRNRSVEIIYLAQEHLRAGQLLSVVGDRVRHLKARRAFLDGAAHIVGDETNGAAQLRQVLFRLTSHFKTLDVTSIVAIESRALHFGRDATERGLSPSADNLLMLRYVATADEMVPALRILKTRGSDHGRGTYALTIGDSGMRIGPPVRGADPPKARRPKERRR